MIPESDLEAAVYKDASLIITIRGQQVTIPIEVTITACSPNLKFESAKITEEYVLGSGSKSIQFPSLIQAPACGLDLGAFVVNFSSSYLASEAISMALKLSEDGKGLTVDTSDSAFLGQTVTVTVTLSESDSRRVKKAEHLEV